MVKKLLNMILRRYYIAVRVFPRKIDMMSAELKNGSKKFQKMSEDFRFIFQFSPLCGHFIPLVSRLGQSAPSMFSNMLKCSQGHEACKVLALSPGPVTTGLNRHFLQTLVKFPKLAFLVLLLGD